MRKTVIFVVLLVSIIMIVLATGCIDQNKVISVNVYSFSDAVARVTVYDNNQLLFEKISSDGEVKILKIPYSRGILHSMKEASDKGIVFDSGSEITSLPYIEVEAKEPWYLIESSMSEGGYIVFGLSTNGKPKSPVSTKDAPIEVYVFGAGTYTGSLGYSKDGKYTSTTVGSTMPDIQQLSGNVNHISLAFQNGNHGPMTVLIYDTDSRKILNSGSTKKNYGVVTLTS